MTEVLKRKDWEGFNLWLRDRFYQVVYNTKTGTIGYEGNGGFVVKGTTKVPLKYNQ